MSYQNGTPDGELYIGTVKWSNDYKHIMLFPNKATRTNFLKNQLNKLANNIVAIPSANSYIDVAGTVGGLGVYNYIMYKNSSAFSDDYFCCFITDFEILASGNTRFYISLDVFQQYFYDTQFYNSIVERGHISKAEDNRNWQNYTAPEPISAPAEVDRNVDIFNSLSFEPVLTFDAISKPDTPQGSTTVQYSYGGNGTDAENATGYFRFRPTATAIAQKLLTGILYFWSEGEAAQTNISHLGDLIGFNFLPQWAVSAASWSDYNANTDFVKELNNNNLITTATDNATLNNTTLACGYPPVNKKMFTNLARALKLYTKNGTVIPLAPNELTNKFQIGIRLHMRPMGTTYKVELIGYRDIDKRFFDLQYGYSIAFGINNNVGTAQQTGLDALNNQVAILKAGQQIEAHQALQKTIGLATAPASAAIQSGGNLAAVAESAVTSVVDIFNYGRELDLSNAKMVADNFNYRTALKDAVASITASIGNNSDRTTMTNDFCKLRLADCSPTIENCRIIDDFLTVYGYSINEIKNPVTFMKSRPLFNYIKTVNINLHTLAPANYENILKQIFDNGTTLWHYEYNNNTGYDNFGDYELNNWDE